MKEIKIVCPAKINLDLRVFTKDEKTGFHPIKSIMQTISLFDYLLIKVSNGNKISISGSSKEIPYNESNLCHKAAKKVLEKINKKYNVEIYIEKNIPVCAGLAGGSTDAAGVIYGLNKLLDYPLNLSEMHDIANEMGSDISFCLRGGTQLCTGKGEKMIEMPFYNFRLSLIKPKKLKISAKEAYEAFDKLEKESDMRNDLEFALLQTKKYPELEYLSSLGYQMSGSGPTYFLRDGNIKLNNNDYIIINNLTSVNYGVVDVQ